MLLRQLVTIRIPDVVTSDLSTNNIIDSPYMIQTRVRGSTLYPHYPSMSQELKCGIVWELGNVLCALHSIRFTHAGTISLSPEIDSLFIESFDLLSSVSTLPYQEGKAALPISTTLHKAVESQRQLATEGGSKQPFRVWLLLCIHHLGYWNG